MYMSPPFVIVRQGVVVARCGVCAAMLENGVKVSTSLLSLSLKTHTTFIIINVPGSLSPSYFSTSVLHE